MISAGAYILAAALLAALVLSLGVSAVFLRRRLLPEWEGAPAHLVEAIVGVALLIWLGELLGTFGLLYGWSLVASSLLLAGILAWRLHPSQLGKAPLSAGGAAGGPAPEEASATAGGGGSPAATGPAGPGPFALLVTVGVIAMVFAHWGLTTKDALDRGIFNFDSLWYHLPFATDIAQSHSVTGLHYTDTVFTNWFYPQNSELLHAVGILLAHRDTLSLFLNFGWLAIAFLAAWCIGRPYGRGHLTVAAAAIPLECHTLVVREPGAAKNDLMAAALLLAAVAILVNAWTAQRDGAGGRGQGRRSLPTGWPLAAAGLAAGMAAGTKFTVLAMAAALTVAVLVLAPGGRRWAAARWWSLPAFAAGGFWYLRNLIAIGNPLPQVRDLGPISLPGPERLQIARPEFSIAHYATDTGVWREYFAPGLHDQFGLLWPLVLGAAVLGAALALLRGRDRAVRWIGGIALFGLLAYLFTPLSAAGADGAPVAFDINVRFAIPALLLGLVLLPLARGLESERRQWALLAALLAVFVVSDRSDAVLRDPARTFGLLIAALAVLAPAGLLYARRRGASAAAVSAGFAALALAAVAIGYPVQRDYLSDRFRNDVPPEERIPGMNLDSAYRWARELSGVRIGLAGTTAGFLQYGFYGTDLSNRVVYLGKKGPHGAFDAIQTCRGFRAAVNAADLDYLVTAPFLNFIDTDHPVASPEAGWLHGEKALTPLQRSGPVTVWKVHGQLDPAGCGPANAPLRALPDAPGSAPPDSGPLGTPTAPGNAGAILASRPRIAILGDSYSAGEGAGGYLEGSDTDDSACHRSRRTYLVEAFELPDPYILACSGAETGDVLSPQAGMAVDAQIDQLIELRDERGVDAVFMTLGGNDAGFLPVARSCLLGRPAGCEERIYPAAPFGLGEPTESFVGPRLAALPASLRRVYVEVDRILNGRRQGRDVAPILVPAYPLPTPRRPRPCRAMRDQLDPAELEFLDRLLSRLNGVVRDAVDSSREAGIPVFFVPATGDAFQPDHTVCDREPYARTLDSFDWERLRLRWGDLPFAVVGRALRGIREFVHPTRDGYAATTRALLRWSRGAEAAAALRSLRDRSAAR